MKLRAAKVGLTLGCLLCVGGSLAPTADAGVIPSVYNAIFGPVGSAGYQTASYAPMTTMYGPTTTMYGPTTSMYAPTTTYYGADYGATGGAGCCGTSSNVVYYRRGLFGRRWIARTGSGCCGQTSNYGAGFAMGDGCNSCGSSACGPTGCGASGCGPTGCANGQCGVNSAPTPAGPLTPVPERGGVPRTYDENAPRPGDRIDSDGFRPAEGTPPEPGFEQPNKTPAADSNSAIRPSYRKPLPTNFATPFSDDDGSIGNNGNINGPTLQNLKHLDSKVTWRPTATWERTALSAGSSSVRVQRKPLFAKSGWVAPTENEVIAKK